MPLLSDDDEDEDIMPAKSGFSLALNKIPGKSALSSCSRRQPGSLRDSEDGLESPMLTPKKSHFGRTSIVKEGQLERASITFSQSPFEVQTNEDSGGINSLRMPSMRVPSKSSLRAPSMLRNVLPQGTSDDDDDYDEDDPLGIMKKGGSHRGSLIGFGRGNKLTKLEMMEMLNQPTRLYEAPKVRARETLVEKLRQKNLPYLQDTNLVTTRRLNAFNSKAEEQANKLEQQQQVVQNATSALEGALSLNLDVGQLSDNLAKTCLTTVGRISVVDRHQVRLRALRSQLQEEASDPPSLPLMEERPSDAGRPSGSLSIGERRRPSRSSTMISNLSAFASMVTARTMKEKDDHLGYPVEWAQESEELLLRPRERTVLASLAPKAPPKKSKKKGGGKKRAVLPPPPAELHPILRVQGPPAPFQPSMREVNDCSFEARSANIASSLIKKNPGLTNFEEVRKDQSRAANISARAKRFLEVSNVLPKDTLVGGQLNRKLTEIRYTRPFLKFPTD